jgi:hypothetical protein
LTVTVRWNEAGKSDADDERVVTPDLDKKPDKQQGEQETSEKRAESEESQRKRKDSGYSASSSGRTSPRDLSDDETAYETVFSETEFSEERKSSKRRFSKFDPDRPARSLVRVNKATSTLPSRISKSSTRRRRRQRERVSRPDVRASMFRRRDVYDRSMLLLHHGGMSRLDQLALKTKLMNTCGFCFKNFREGVSLSQHIEELKHWACTRCGKYFESYTALGQHKLALDHCNVV